jgi:hypothetical protein
LEKLDRNEDEKNALKFLYVCFLGKWFKDVYYFSIPQKIEVENNEKNHNCLLQLNS